LAYGRGHLTVSLPVGRTEVMEQLFQPGLPDERTAVEQALASPICRQPLVRWCKPGSRICIVFTDITRGKPSERIIPWILESLARAGAKDSQIALKSQFGRGRWWNHFLMKRCCRFIAQAWRRVAVRLISICLIYLSVSSWSVES
jgi:hypothetical protein